MDKKRIFTLFLIVLADMSGAAAILPIIPVFVLEQFHANPFEAALVVPVYYVAQALAAPWLGNLSDRFGRRPLLLISQVGTIVSYLLIVLVVPLGALLDHLGLSFGLAGGIIIIYFARILDGVTGGNISVAQAYASDISTPEERTHALGLVGGASGLGHILGPALAGLLAGFSMLAPFMAAAAVSAITFIMTLLWLHEPAQHPAHADTQTAAPRIPLAQLLARRPIALILATTLTIGLYMAALFGIFSLYADKVLLPAQDSVTVVRTTGWLITVMGLVMALTQVVLLKPLVGHLGERRAVLVGSFLMLVSAVGFFAFTSVWGAVICMILFALGYGMAWPVLQALLTGYGKEEEAGRLLGWFQTVFSVALIVGPVWSGYVFDAAAPQTVFAISAGLMVLALILSVGIQRLQLTALHHEQKAMLKGFHH